MLQLQVISAAASVDELIVWSGNNLAIASELQVYLIRSTCLIWGCCYMEEEKREVPASQVYGTTSMQLAHYYFKCEFKQPHFCCHRYIATRKVLVIYLSAPLYFLPCNGPSNLDHWER